MSKRRWWPDRLAMKTIQIPGRITSHTRWVYILMEFQCCSVANGLLHWAWFRKSLKVWYFVWFCKYSQILLTSICSLIFLWRDPDSLALPNISSSLMPFISDILLSEIPIRVNSRSPQNRRLSHIKFDSSSKSPNPFYGLQNNMTVLTQQVWFWVQLSIQLVRV